MSTIPVLTYQPRNTNTDGPLRWLGWAIYLAMSWTWCIGMFLPVLLVRDYGIWGWVVFAVPNVLGAAAMGWVISAQTSRAAHEAHDRALRAFSIVTVAFQLFFAAWIFPQVGLTTMLTGATVLFSACFVTAMHRRLRIAHIIAAAVLAASVALWWQASRYGEMPAHSWFLEQIKTVPSSGALWLAPAFLFGFALCPYLDRTFHEARASLSDPSARTAFGIGFGAAFLSMLVFALYYSVPVAFNLVEPGVQKDNTVRLVGYFWSIQLAFTIAAHLTAGGERGGSQLYLSTAIACGIALVAILAVRGSHLSGETMYRLFLGFYGLVSPAYVWLCMIPGRGRLAPTRRQLAALAGSVALAAPFFWMGVVDGKMPWLLPGLVVVLLARLLVPSAPQQSEAPPRTATAV